jgi:hypothetical protein
MVAFIIIIMILEEILAGEIFAKTINQDSNNIGIEVCCERIEFPK